MTVAPIGCSDSALGKREPVTTTVVGAASSAQAAKGRETAMAQASASGFLEIIELFFGRSLGRRASPHAGSSWKRGNAPASPCLAGIRASKSDRPTFPSNR